MLALERVVNTFALSTLLIALAIVTFLMFIARQGYWPCVIASTVIGSLVLTTIPALIIGSPRFVFTTLGAIGAVCGCWVGARVYSLSMTEPTEFLTRREYEIIFWRHLFLSIFAMLSACIAGGTIGMWMCYVASRNSNTH